MDDFKSLLKVKLKEKLTESGISVNALEKQAGLKRSAVHNILHDRSKKPSIEILHAISRVFDCSVDELINPSSNARNTRTTHETVLNSESDNGPINIDLYAKAAQIASELFNANNLTLNKQQALGYINEVYQYSLRNEATTIDRNFAEWLIDKVKVKQENYG